jgi:uncharacterized protein DUF4252
MKTTIALLAFTLLVPVAASAQGARLNLSFLDRLAERASEKQEITIDKNMLQGFGGTLVPAGPKGDAAKQILSELEGVYVRSYEFDDQKAFSMDDINAIRKQLSAPGWSRIVANEEKGKGGDFELQEVWLFNPGGKLGGVFVINAEPGELQVINIVGPIDLAKIGALGGILGIPGGIAAGLVK